MTTRIPQPSGTEKSGHDVPSPPNKPGTAVRAWSEPLELPTYAPTVPDRNPMFLETRVYQGSSGAVYPLPFIDRIEPEAKLRLWEAVHIENEWLRLTVLPELGGRIHVGFDKVANYDFFYRQNVIKPALVGLAGPWISGGVEFNWPQHHRPATFMPVEVEIESGEDGSATIWCSDHDPFSRMKGMHGVCLYPDRAYIELKVRLYNRTQIRQTFLWWANVAARVHERYQSFFPPDVRYVADHAKRAITTFPLCDRDYYGVHYSERALSGVPADETPAQFRPDGSYASNDLSWYANIPVPTSYMIVGSNLDFFGGYDHARRAGFVHYANHHIAPGKKQWTWGNHEFGYAWDRNLTDADGPYIELMAGVYTDNQPDFSFLAPGETKSFSQFWYPIRTIGIPQAANLDAAISIDSRQSGPPEVGVAVTRDLPDAKVEVWIGDALVVRWAGELRIVEPLFLSLPASSSGSLDRLLIEVSGPSGSVLRYAPDEIVPASVPQTATEPPAPVEIESIERLYLTGVHLAQYRHATRMPQPYWEEALRRDPGDSRSHSALGVWRLNRGELELAERHFCSAIERLTERNPNPTDGGPFYHLGLTFRFLGRDEEAYANFYKATWLAEFKAPAYLALAELDARAQRWQAAYEHIDRSVRANADNNNARNLAVVILNRLERKDEAEALLRETRRIDRLDVWARYLETGIAPGDPQQCIDLAIDFLRAGLREEALDVLGSVDLKRRDRAAPMVAYLLAAIYEQSGNAENARSFLEKAGELPTDYVFPHRLEEILLLERICGAHPADGRAAFYLGNALYDHRRYDDAIFYWERSAEREPSLSTVWRNLGIAYFNVRTDIISARSAYDKAITAAPEDARVLYEHDQLWKRIGEIPEERLAELRRHPDLLTSRDDLTIEHATLLNQTGNPQEALHLMSTRQFQPWEGGEGLVLQQYVRSQLLLGKRRLNEGNAPVALLHFQAALQPPPNLSEARHLLANASDIYFWIGKAHRAHFDEVAARAALERAANQRGDFQQMSVRTVSDMTYWSALALRELGEEQRALDLFNAILAYSDKLDREEPKIDYFATSLPTMLLFHDDLKKRAHVDALFLRAQARMGIGNIVEARDLLDQVLSLDRNHTGAADLLGDLATLARAEIG